MAKFNLVDEPWIPVRTSNGQLETWSLENTLLHADRVRRLEDPSPLVLAALHRFLLAVLHRAVEGPATSEQAARWYRGGFPATVLNAYLKHWRDRFDLFDATHPFFQVAELDRVTEPKPWTILLAEEGSSNTTVLFNPSRRPDYHAVPAPADVAARALLAYQTFALGGLMRVFGTSAVAGPAASAALVLVLGDNLQESLALNLVPHRAADRDVPIWERDGVLAVAHMQRRPEERARGHVHAYTWPSRSVLLHPETLNGRAMVCMVRIAQGVRLEEGKAYERDPMVAYRYDKTRGLVRVRARSDRGFWRDFDALLPHKTAGVETAPGVVTHACAIYRALGLSQHVPKTMVIGLVSDQMKIKSWRAELFELPPETLRGEDVYDQVAQALTHAEESGKHLWDATVDFAEALMFHGDHPPRAKNKFDVARTLSGATYYWSTLALHFPALLSQVTPNPAERDRVLAGWLWVIHTTLRDAWEQTVRAAGDDAAALRAVARGTRVLNGHLANLYQRAHSA